MSLHSVLMIVGWVVLVASWVLPRMLCKDKTYKNMWSVMLASFALGIFVANMINQLLLLRFVA